jgi:hypothetical protein
MLQLSKQPWVLGVLLVGVTACAGNSAVTLSSPWMVWLVEDGDDNVELLGLLCTDDGTLSGRVDVTAPDDNTVDLQLRDGTVGDGLTYVVDFAGERTEPDADASVDITVGPGETLAVDNIGPGEGNVGQPVVLYLGSQAGVFSSPYYVSFMAIDTDQDWDEDGYPFHLGCDPVSPDVQYDCDDFDATVHPDAEEPGDGVDHDCDGVPDL